MIPIQQDESFTIREPALATEFVANVARQAEGSKTRNTLNRYAPPARLEVEDAFFHHDSAVMMPDTVLGREQDTTKPFLADDSNFMSTVREFHPRIFSSFAIDTPDPGPLDEESNRVSGLGVLAATYRFLELNSRFRLLIAGHCDTTGTIDYNFDLSERRAKNVLFLLQGDRKGWVDSSLRHSKVEDQKRILKHIARVRLFDCDPSTVDNQQDEALSAALKRFQDRYNADFHRSILVDGKMGEQTWGAFFDVYMDELASILKITVEGLSSHRQQVRFVDSAHPFIACGEKLPIDQPQRDEFRSQENRRVEFLFFSQRALPDLSCHAATTPFCMKNVLREECGVYALALFNFIPIDPAFLDVIVPPSGTQGKFVILEANEDLSKLADKPDEQYASTMTTSEFSDREDPWAFLEFFVSRDPGVLPLERPNQPGGDTVLV